MAVYHPDHGGDSAEAARLNETYARMIDWLERRHSRSAAAEKRSRDRTISPTMGLRARAAKIAGAAFVAMAALAAMRNSRRR
jgi:hypothetical protein